MRPPEALLEEVVHRLVEAVHPARIILFGSAARGMMGRNSDLDLLVVVPDGLPHADTWNAAHLSLRRIGVATDLVMVDESDLAKHGENPGLVLRQALLEGRELYRAA